MKTKHILIAICYQLSSICFPVFAQGTTFTYQGQLQNNGSPASGTYNLTFTLFPTITGGFAVAGPVTNNAVAVSNGLFTVLIDFGSGVFTGQTNWLEIAARTNGSGAFTTLSPRQQLTPAPYAIYSESAGGLVGLSVQQNTNGAPNLIGGSPVNYVSPGVLGATISGGGATNYFGASYSNSVTANFGTVGGGEENTAGYFSTIAGGLDNTANDGGAVVGGYLNHANGNDSAVIGGVLNSASGDNATVGGGYENLADGTGAFIGGGGTDGTITAGNYAAGNASVIGGGIGNVTEGPETTVGGGETNYVGDLGATVSGGLNNTVVGNFSMVGGGQNNYNIGYAAVIAGGQSNTNLGVWSVVVGGTGNNSVGLLSTVAGGSGNVASGTGATVSGGEQNIATNVLATVGGGQVNQANGQFSTVGGGGLNYANGDYSSVGGGGGNGASGIYSTVGGGTANTASGTYATVPGGGGNLASGSNSFAAGNLAQALHSGSFVWADNSATSSFSSTAANQFLIRASGGVGIDTATPGAALEVDTTNHNGNEIRFGYYTGGAGNLIAGPSYVGIATGDLTTRLAILQGTGLVGIGTVNPDALLSVNGTADKPGGGSWTSFSDGRLKDIGANFTHGLEALNGIQPVHYHYKAANPLNLPSQPEYVGVVAQQVQQAVPEAVQRSENGYLTVNNDPIIWTMVNAIKELNQKRETEAKEKDAEIQDLKQRLETLEKIVLNQKSNSKE